jgi:cytochrome c peroxidase
MIRVQVVSVGLSLIVLASSCSSSSEPSSSGFTLPADPSNYAPLAGFAKMNIPADNPITAEGAALGRQLYYDTRLSGDGSRSCYQCHVCEKGLTDGLETAVGAFDKQLTRSSPTLWNIGFHSYYYWDGRKDTLEGQAAAAWKGGNMGAGENFQEIVAKINSMEAYRSQFQSVFGEDANDVNIPKALASYMRTIIGGNTPWDRWLAGDESAVSDAAKRGYEVFQQANCTQCHSGKLFTDMVFHNVGIGYDPSTQTYADDGRFQATNDEKDKGAFKTPTLRDISQSAPYFHDGSVPTLDIAVRLMLAGGVPNPRLDVNMKKVELTEEQIGDLIAFLESLDEDCDMPAPKLP